MTLVSMGACGVARQVASIVAERRRRYARRISSFAGRTRSLELRDARVEAVQIRRTSSYSMSLQKCVF